GLARPCGGLHPVPPAVVVVRDLQPRRRVHHRRRGAGHPRRVPRLAAVEAQPGGVSPPPRARLTSPAHGRTVAPKRRRQEHRERIMADTFKAILVSRDEDKKQSVDMVDLTDADLMEGDVTVAVEATTVNYKDGLAITGRAPVIRRWPLVPGKIGRAHV